MVHALIDKSLLMFRGGLRSFKKTLEGSEREFFYKARTPAEVAACRGAIAGSSNDEGGFVARDKFLGKFIASSLCNEDGTALMTPAEAQNIPDTLKLELAILIVNGSTQVGDAGKD